MSQSSIEQQNLYSLPQMAYIMLFVENTDNLVLLQGEKDYAPDVCTLIGGKVGDQENLSAYGLNEKYYPWIALLREIDEEAGHPLDVQNLSLAFNIITPHKGEKHLLNVFTGTVSPHELSQANPPEGKIVTYSLHNIQQSPIDNVEYSISPMNNYIIQTYKENGICGRQTFETYTPFISINEFQNGVEKQKTLNQSSAQPA
jgi:hypothetical protein